MKKHQKILFSILLVLSILIGNITSAKISLSNRQKYIIKKITEICTKEYYKYGVLPSTCISQAMNESTLGNKVSNKNNLWGIKNKSGDGYRYFNTLEDGIYGYLEVINNGLYDKALFKKSTEVQIREILNGGYCPGDNNYYNNTMKCCYNWDFKNYDSKLFKKIKEKKQKKIRKKKQKHLFTFKYDPSIKGYNVMVDKKIIPKGTIAAYHNDELILLSDVIPGSKDYIIKTNILKLNGLKVKLEVQENAKG